MARLSKKEQQRRAEEAMQARERAALHWTDLAPAPDVMPPEGSGLSTGYTFNVYAQRVDVACSGAVSHSVGRTDRTTTQGARRLYSTKLLALQALRNAMEREFAKRLAAIDVQIESESA
jgi:hypothetical protein